MTALLCLNSWALSLSTDDGDRASDIGAAFVDGGELRFGSAALQQCRLNPRLSHVSYLEQLTADPLAMPGHLATNQADLVYLQIKALAEQASLSAGSPVVAAVPGNLSADQLGLFLAIAAEAGVSVGGFVDRSVLDACDRELPPRLAHLDVQLGGACLSFLDVRDEVTRTESRWLGELGLLPAIDRCVTAIAARFVDSTRFDPLKIAATEQQLFDQVYATFDGAHSTELAIEVDYAGAQRRLDTSDDLIESALTDRYAALLTDLADISCVLASTEALNLPGLSDALVGAGKAVVIADGSHRQRVLSAQRERLIASDSVLYTTALPARLANTDGQSPQALAPSHVLSGDTAQPLGRVIDGVHYLQEADGSVRAVSTNGRDLQRGTQCATEHSQLGIGDSLSIDGHEHRLIRVTD